MIGSATVIGSDLSLNTHLLYDTVNECTVTLMEMVWHDMSCLSIVMDSRSNYRIADHPGITIIEMQAQSLRQLVATQQHTLCGIFQPLFCGQPEQPTSLRITRGLRGIVPSMQCMHS